MFDMVEFSMV